jgi:hypothetical protein
METQEYKQKLKDMIDYLQKFDDWLSGIHVNRGEEDGRREMLRQTREAMKKFKNEIIEYE